MEQNTPTPSEDPSKKKSAEDPSSAETSIENGKKIIDIQNDVQEHPEKKQEEDADKWRNEG